VQEPHSVLVVNRASAVLSCTTTFRACFRLVTCCMSLPRFYDNFFFFFSNPIVIVTLTPPRKLIRHVSYSTPGRGARSVDDDERCTLCVISGAENVSCGHHVRVGDPSPASRPLKFFLMQQLDVNAAANS
jgi:hypothetical protein